MQHTSSDIQAQALDQAAEWLMRLHQGDATEAERQACRQWQQARPENGRAWARAEALMNKLGTLPPAIALPVLQAQPQRQRRAAMARLAALVAALPAAWLGWRGWQSSSLAADHRSATGQRREVVLADGTRVLLNTETAIDVRFDAQRRLLRLRQGEIMVSTGHDSQLPARPFYVETSQGLLLALGTRFSVRQLDGRTQLAVFEHAVRIEPRRLPATGWITVPAGSKASFSENAIDSLQATTTADQAWVQGMLVADNMRLDDFSRELARYLPGLLRCEPEVANVRVSGTFPLEHPERILTMLVSTYPVQAWRRFGGYWVTLAAPA